jgi:hypothetical protein
MSPPRPGVAGTRRICPHCKASILESAAVCPACRHHLRFDGQTVRFDGETVQRAVPSFTPLRVEGTIHHPDAAGEPWEYSLVISIQNERGEEISRQVVGVGALNPAEERTFAFAVEVFTPSSARVPVMPGT